MVDIPSWETRDVALADMNPAPYNPRKMSDSARSGLSGSLDSFGMLKTLVWNERTGNIVGGHQRYMDLSEKGEVSVSATVVDLSSEDEVELNLALNNPFVRGQFTSLVVDLLQEVADSLPDAFAASKLDDLYNYVKRLNFDGEGAGSDPGPKPSPGDVPDGHVAVVTCPRCRDRFRMDTGKAVMRGVVDAND